MNLERKKGRGNRLNVLAHADLDRLNANPIEMLVEVYKEAMNAYKTARGYSEKGDAGAAYLGVAGKAAVDLAKFKHPTLSAVALKDMTDQTDKKPLSTSQAIDIIKADPFAPQDLKDIPTDRIVDAMKSTIKAPALPMGDKK
jgi:hypothetical protein